MFCTKNAYTVGGGASAGLERNNPVHTAAAAAPGHGVRLCWPQCAMLIPCFFQADP